MAAVPEDLADPEPFSPSDFLDLPPTPQPDGDGHAPAPAPALQEQGDDLALPFITRVLMEDEEDIDDDHPALLEAQQPFADILSHAAAAGSSTAKSDGSSRLPFSDAPAFADNVTWPYDPVELSHQLLIGVVGQHDDLLPPGEDDNRVTMEMLNLAFLKGMEEANKFLPTTTNSLEPRESGSNGRGRKSRHSNWDDNMDAETGRSCKLMAPAETDEAADEFILNGYQSLLDKMMDMSIGRDREAEKNTRKKHRRGCGLAQAAAAAGDRLHAAELLTKIKQRSSPSGDATQRLAHCFAKGLEARLAGTGSQVYKSLLVSQQITSSAVEFYKAYQLFLAVCCFQMVAFKFSNMTICRAIAGRKKVHVVDYGDHYGFQWPTLLGFRPAARIESTGRRLSSFARQCSIDDLKIQPDQVLIVSGLFHFGKLLDEGGDLDSPNPRDMVLSNIRNMRPDVFILCVENSSYNAPFYYSAMFDMMDSTAPRDSVERVLVEQELFGRCALNAIAGDVSAMAGAQRPGWPEAAAVGCGCCEGWSSIASDHGASGRRGLGSMAAGKSSFVRRGR